MNNDETTAPFAKRLGLVFQAAARLGSQIVQQKVISPIAKNFNPQKIKRDHFVDQMTADLKHCSKMSPDNIVVQMGRYGLNAVSYEQHYGRNAFDHDCAIESIKRAYPEFVKNKNVPGYIRGITALTLNAAPSPEICHAGAIAMTSLGPSFIEHSPESAASYFECSRHLLDFLPKGSARHIIERSLPSSAFWAEQTNRSGLFERQLNKQYLDFKAWRDGSTKPSHLNQPGSNEP